MATSWNISERPLQGDFSCLYLTIWLNGELLSEVVRGGFPEEVHLRRS